LITRQKNYFQPVLVVSYRETNLREGGEHQKYPVLREKLLHADKNLAPAFVVGNTGSAELAHNPWLSLGSMASFSGHACKETTNRASFSCQALGLRFRLQMMHENKVSRTYQKSNSTKTSATALDFSTARTLKGETGYRYGMSVSEDVFA
jgi:hypothetical protein